MAKDELEFIRRLLEIYSLEEILEFNDMTPEEAVEVLINYGDISLDDIPTGLS